MRTNNAFWPASKDLAMWPAVSEQATDSWTRDDRVFEDVNAKLIDMAITPSKAADIMTSIEEKPALHRIRLPRFNSF
ncbi:MAG: hypothetical protein ABL958_04980 [Bdellovibrionia bacterium]